MEQQKAGFLQRNVFTRPGKDWKDRACMSVSLFTSYTCERPLFVGLLS